MKSRMSFNILVAAVATGACALVGEFAVRRIGLASPLPTQYRNYTSTPHLTYGPKPSSHVTGESFGGEFTHDYRHNGYGFRDDEREPAKPEGTFRILWLGDSFTYGVGASFEETDLFVLEQTLNERRGPSQCRNHQNGHPAFLRRSRSVCCWKSSAFSSSRIWSLWASFRTT